MVLSYLESLYSRSEISSLQLDHDNVLSTGSRDYQEGLSFGDEVSNF